MSKKLLFVVDERKLGGVSIVLENLLNNINLDTLNVTVLVLHNNGNRLENLDKRISLIYGNKAFNIIDLDLKGLIKKGKLIKAVKKINLSLKMKSGSIKDYIISQRKKLGLYDNEFDVEIAFKSGFCSLFVAYGKSKKKINWVHEDYESYNKTKRYEDTFKEAFKLFDTHVIVSNKAAKSFNDIYNMKDKTIVIENYIDETRIKGLSNIDPIINVDKDKLNIVTLGRFCQEKGFDRLIEAAKTLRDEIDISKLQIYIVGYGEEEKLLNDKIILNNLQDNIKVINNNEIFKGNPYSFIKTNDIYIMPSRTESFGMVRIEALILGLPVITTNVANTENMISETNGIVVENSTNGILEGLRKALSDTEYFIKLKKGLVNYSYSKENERIINKVQKLLEE